MYSSVATEHDGALRRFVPERVEDGEVDGEGDGSDAYQPGNDETPERWHVPAEMALMGVRVGDLTSTQMYAANSPISYYLRKEPTAERNMRLFRHRGSILPFCKVIHIVHPYTAYLIAHRGSPPDVSEEAWDRVRKAVSGENVSPDPLPSSRSHSFACGG
ncbi:MAG: hypothetical protein Q9184_006471 [Pyrenodesmia sp. 2 TL-2023]